MDDKLQYSRYSSIKDKTFPFIEISKRRSDKKIKWERGNNMAFLSYKYYGDSRYGWLIMLANKEYSIEFDIEENTIIRIPLPFREVLDEVITKIEDYK